MRVRRVLTALLAPAALAACASGPGGRKAAKAPGVAATLEVRNDHLSPVNVFAVRDGGVTRRLGSVTGRVQRFRLTGDLVGGGAMVRFFAVPVAGGGRANTAGLLINDGDVVQFNVAQDLRASSVFVK